MKQGEYYIEKNIDIDEEPTVIYLLKYVGQDKWRVEIGYFEDNIYRFTVFILEDEDYMIGQEINRNFKRTTI